MGLGFIQDRTAVVLRVRLRAEHQVLAVLGERHAAKVVPTLAFLQELPVFLAEDGELVGREATGGVSVGRFVPIASVGAFADEVDVLGHVGAVAFVVGDLGQAQVHQRQTVVHEVTDELVHAGVVGVTNVLVDMGSDHLEFPGLLIDGLAVGSLERGVPAGVLGIEGKEDVVKILIALDAGGVQAERIAEAVPGCVELLHRNAAAIGHVGVVRQGVGGFALSIMDGEDHLAVELVRHGEHIGEIALQAQAVVVHHVREIGLGLGDVRGAAGALVSGRHLGAPQIHLAGKDLGRGLGPVRLPVRNRVGAAEIVEGLLEVFLDLGHHVRSLAAGHVQLERIQLTFHHIGGQAERNGAVQAEQVEIVESAQAVGDTQIRGLFRFRNDVRRVEAGDEQVHVGDRAVVAAEIAQAGMVLVEGLRDDVRIGDGGSVGAGSVDMGSAAELAGHDGVRPGLVTHVLVHAVDIGVEVGLRLPVRLAAVVVDRAEGQPVVAGDQRHGGKKGRQNILHCFHTIVHL